MLYLIEILHQTTTHHLARVVELLVVSYRNSTSNHNLWQVRRLLASLYLIEILHQTTTRRYSFSLLGQLYLIEILHQTTTCGKCEDCLRRLYLIEILHQTTTCFVYHCCVGCCILSKFYIKPQLYSTKTAYIDVVSYRNSTSNHNPAAHSLIFLMLYLIEILHQTTTIHVTCQTGKSCILSKFYIKPQHGGTFDYRAQVVSYRNSTSNHNIRRITT